MDWHEECVTAADLFEKGDYATAADIFVRLCEREDIADMDRAYMGYNLARTHDKLGDPESAAASYDFAASMAIKPYVWFQELRAAYLYEHGRRDDAVAVWEHLLTLDLLLPERRAAIEHNLKAATST